MNAVPVIARNVIWLAGGELLVKSSVLAATAIVGRFVGPAGLGELTVAWGAMLVAVTITSGGQVEVLIRATATGPGAALAHLRRSIQVSNTLAVAVAIVLCSVAALADRPGLQSCLLSFVPYALLRSRLIVTAAPHKGLDRMGVETRARAIESAIALPLLIVGVLTIPSSWLAGAAFTVGAAVATTWIGTQKRWLPAQSPSPDALGTVRAHWREGASFMALALTLQLLLRSDTLLMALLGIPSEAIGQYGVASMWVWGVLAGPQLLAMAIYPTFSRTAGHGAGSVRATHSALILGVLSGTTLACGLYLARAPLVQQIYGAGFADAERFLAALAWALPGAGAAMCLGTVLAAWNRQKWTLLAYIGAVVMTVSANVYWIPKTGPIAAAVAAVAVQTTLALILTVAASQAGRRTRERA